MYIFSSQAQLRELCYLNNKIMQKNITYKTGIVPPIETIIELYDDSGINRPTTDKPRIKKMYQHANLVITAWDGEQLVGISRSITNFCYCCYLSDLAVKKAYQKQGIGKKLIALTKEEIGKDAMLLLLSAPSAMAYYPKVGLETVNNGFIIHREKTT